MSPLPDHAEQVQERAAAADNTALAAELRLCMVSGVGPLMRKKLLERFGSAAGVFKAAPSELREVDGVGPKLAREITAAEREIDVEKEIAFCRENRITLLLESNDAYPRPLKD